jgi:hypothetical protein
MIAIVVSRQSSVEASQESEEDVTGQRFSPGGLGNADDHPKFHELYLFTLNTEIERLPVAELSSLAATFKVH